jgi:hypothetical protein
MKGFRDQIARSMRASDPKVARSFLASIAEALDLDERELSHRLEAQLDTAVSKARPAVITPAGPLLSESVNRDITDVVRELELGVERGDFGRPHWLDEERDIIG